MLARAWQAGPGAAPFTIDLDSTICETYGLDKEGARHHGYTSSRGYHPLLAVAAGTGDVLLARRREGRANTARGAAHFLRETVSRVFATVGPRDSSLYGPTAASTPTPWSPSAAGWMSFSSTIRQHKGLRELIEAIPEEDWTPIPYLSRAAAKHTTVAKRKCTTGVMGDGSDLGVSGGTGTVGRGPWEDYEPACSGADDAEAFSRLPLRR